MVCVTAVLWGILPILLRRAVALHPAAFIGCFRLLLAFLVLSTALSLRGLKPLRIVCCPPWPALAAGVLLAGNYYFFIKGIGLAGASLGGLVIQSGPLFLFGFACLLFGERLSLFQAGGVICALSGATLFYFGRISIGDARTCLFGVICVLFAGLCWAAFAVVCKRCARNYDAQLLNVVIFGTAGLCLLPCSEMSSWQGLQIEDLPLLCLLGAITVVAYGSFVEALRAMPATHVSVIIACNPLLTLVLMSVMTQLEMSYISAEPISLSGYAGALLAVLGIALVVGRQESAEGTVEKFAQNGQWDRERL